MEADNKECVWNEETYYFIYCTTESGKVFFKIIFFFFATCGKSCPFL